MTAGAFAQMSSFPKPSYFRETFQKTQTKVELKDPVKLKDFVVADKLELSLKHYLALVMSNNTDIQIQMLQPGDAQECHPARLGRLGSPGDGAVHHDPGDHPADQRPGRRRRSENVDPAADHERDATSAGGLNYTVSWGGTKTTSNSSFNNYNPALTSNLAIAFSQPLLQNRGSYVNRLNLMSARSRLKISEFGLKGQMLNLVSTAESAYWDVVSARENLKVAEGARDVAGGVPEAARRSSWSWERFRRLIFIIRSSSWPPTKSAWRRPSSP